MKFRKPRYAKYELTRMGIRELKDLCGKLEIRMLGMREKGDFVEAVLNSGKIILIAAPEPVEYKCVDLLRGMGVGKLKRAMADAGVFFDVKDVVEKEDMVQIFVNSGRIVFLEKGSVEQDGGRSGSGGGGQQERKEYLDPYGNAYSFGDVDVNATNNNDNNNVNSSSSEQNNMNNRNSDHQSNLGDDNYNDNAYDDDYYGEEIKRARLDEIGNSVAMSVSSATATARDVDTSTTATVMEMSDGYGGRGLGERDSDLTASGHGGVNVTEVTNDDKENDIATSQHVEDQEQGQGGEEHPASTSSPEEGPAVGANAEPEHESASASASISQASATNEIELPSFATRSIGELRQLAASLDVDLSGCIEKREMVDLIMNAINRRY